MNHPEILAPAGNREMAEAAVAAGCDALYVGAHQFGARAYSANFSEDELRDLIQFAHWHGVRVFLTVHTLLKEKELDEAVMLLFRLSARGLDAAIVQDLGLIERLRTEVPGLELHASTQMSVNTLAGVRELARMGLKRVVLGRETSIEETKAIVDAGLMETEVFVHGSLCVCVSGQCLLSSFEGGRSGNRGRCAQPCRKTYALERSNGKAIGAEDTYLSPSDLMTLDQMMEYVAAGVDSFKIEGRMKKPEYVFAAVRACRQIMEGQPADGDALRLMTNRPFTKGFGFHDFGLDYGFRMNQRTGLEAGTIERLSAPGKKERFGIRTTRDLHRGDILSLRGGRGWFPMTLKEDAACGALIPVRAGDVRQGDEVRQIYSEAPRLAMKQAVSTLQDSARQSVRFNVWAKTGEPLRVQVACGMAKVMVEGKRIDAARSQAVHEETIRRAFMKCGDTPFDVEDLRIVVSPDAFIPVSHLNAMRREALKRLMEKMTGTLPLSEEHGASEHMNRMTAAAFSDPQTEAAPGFRISLETEQAPDHLQQEAQFADRVVLSDLQLVKGWKSLNVPVFWRVPLFQESRQWEETLRRWRDALPLLDGLSISTLNELGHVRSLLKEYPDLELILESGLNIMNSFALSRLQSALGSVPIASFAPSLEMTAEEIAALPHHIWPLEILGTGPIPGMVMRHCPASMYKGCHDESECAHCPYQGNVRLTNRFGSRLFHRREGITTLYAPEAVDCRGAYDLIRWMHPDWVRIVDTGNDIRPILSDWKKVQSLQLKQVSPVIAPTREAPTRERLGHYLRGIE